MKAIEKYFPFEEIDEIAELESFRKEINRPIYHIHKWWAKRLGSVFRSITSGALSEENWERFHNKQNYSGMVVLDPFMGSGTTLGEAAKLGAKVIGCDVNPVSTFLVRQALTSVSISDLELEFKAIEKDVRKDVQHFYTTKTSESSEPTPALYYFWVAIVNSPDGEEIPLFSSYVFSKNAYAAKKPKSQIICASCWSIFTGMHNSIEEQCPSCGYMFNPQVGPAQGSNVIDVNGNTYKIKKLIESAGHPPRHKLYAIMALDENGNKVYIKPSKYDFDLIESAAEELKRVRIDLPLPRMAVRPGHNTNQAIGYNYRNWEDFFNDRQLLCHGLLLKRILEIADKNIRDHFVCLFSGNLEFNNLFCSFKGEGTGAVRHMFSNHILKPERTPLENTIWGIEGKSSGTFSTLFKSRLIKAKKYLESPFEISIEKNGEHKSTTKIVCSDPIRLHTVEDWIGFEDDDRAALILNGDSSGLPVPSESVDAVITDPPYFDFIHYSELSDFFYAWISGALGGEYKYLSRNDSSHENEVQDKDNLQFSRKLMSIYSECHRVLKKDGLMCFSYHHSTIDGWMAIYYAISGAGFVIVAAHPVKAEMSVATPKSLAKEPINIDAILVCKKMSESLAVADPRQTLSRQFSSYVNRFAAVGRKLSAGDRFVIACSQAISIATQAEMNNEQALSFVTWAGTCSFESISGAALDYSDPSALL